MDSSILLVIPCYNEEKRLPITEYETFLSAATNIHLLFVNDGSSDRTEEILKGLLKKFPDKVTYLALTVNSGKAEAIRQGMLHCCDKPYDYFGYFDADLSTPLTEASRLLSQLPDKEVRMIFGARVDLFGSTSIERSMLRHYFGRVFATLVSNMIGMKVYDTQCGAKLFSRELIRPLFEQTFISRWLFDIELILRLKQHTSSDDLTKHMIELPLKEWREKGASKIGLISLLKLPINLMAIYFSYPRN